MGQHTFTLKFGLLVKFIRLASIPDIHLSHKTKENVTPHSTYYLNNCSRFTLPKKGI